MASMLHNCDAAAGGRCDGRHSRCAARCPFLAGNSSHWGLTCPWNTNAIMTRDSVVVTSRKANNCPAVRLYCRP